MVPEKGTLLRISLTQNLRELRREKNLTPGGQSQVERQTTKSRTLKDPRRTERKITLSKMLKDPRRIELKITVSSI